VGDAGRDQPAAEPRPGRVQERPPVRARAADLLGLAYLSDDAELIIAELVGNAVRHGLRAAPQIRRAGASPSALRLCLLRRVGEVMLAVTDPSDDVPKPKAPSDSGENGRGLQIVGALSYVWGWSPIEGSGKAVWAVLRC